MHAVLDGHVESVTIVDQQHLAGGPADGGEQHDVRRIVADVTEPGEQPALELALASAALVICALPEDALLAAFPRVIAAMPPGALAIDTASVKSHLSVLWSASGPSILSINPMFAPSLSPVGRPVLTVSAGRRGRQDDFLKLLRHNGMRVMPLADADEHDRLAAITQTGVHAGALAYGLTLAASGFSAEQVVALAPPPCRQQLMLLARMTAQSPEVYEDIQRSNPYAEQARADLIENLAQIGRLASRKAMNSAFGDISDWLGSARIPLAELCQNVYDGFAVPDELPQ